MSSVQADGTPYDPDASATLATYALNLGLDVEVELLVVGQPSQVGPRLVEGTVAGATDNVLLITHPSTRRVTRLPWPAIAAIRNATPQHPAHQ